MEKVKGKKEIDEDIVQLSAFAKAMSHPVRMYILMKLSNVNACCYSGDLAEELQVSPSTLSQHFKELIHVGLIQNHMELPYIKYCINQKNWERAKTMFYGLFEYKVSL